MRVLIVAAHPDDETIGASALMNPRHEATVIHVTNGAPREPRWWPAGFADRHAYARQREREAARALALVGASRVALGFDDQEAVCALPELTDALAEQLRRRPDLIVTHAYEGGHPDHDAVALSVALARERVRPPPLVLEMALYHGAPVRTDGSRARPRPPGALTVGEFLDDHGSQRHVLDAEERRRRRAMLDCFASRRSTLAPFLELGHERYRLAPAYDFSQPPHEGPLHYERLGMASGAEWRARAAKALGAHAR